MDGAEEKIFKQSKIDRHYLDISAEIGTNWSSTMLDREIREKEIDNLMKIISQIRLNHSKFPIKILDIGCGNGYVASRLQCEFPNLEIDGIDLNSGMIELANSRKLPNSFFYISSALEIDTLKLVTKSYDLVFSTRCFINIVDENERYESIKISTKYVKPKGFLALMEGFEDGQVSYNLLRSALGFQTIPPAWHNYYLHLDRLVHELSNLLNYVDQEELKTLGLDRHFLSNRYLAMRVLLPLFKDDPDYFNNNRNDPLGLALSNLLPQTYNFSPLQLHLWQNNS